MPRSRAWRRGLRVARGVSLVLAASFAIVWLGWQCAWRTTQVPGFDAVRAAYRPSTAYLVDRHGELLDSARVEFGVRRLQWVPLESISPALTAAVIAGEDRRFHQHHGVDWGAVLAAADAQLRTHRARGASTLTMQLATLLQHERRGGSRAQEWWRKWRQARFAAALESRWSKQQILEAYLNLVEFRGELQGIGAAAQVLAGKAPAGLTLAESWVLAALLPEPAATPARVAARACARAAAVPGVEPVDCAAIRAAAVSLASREHAAEQPASLAPHLAAALLRHPGERVQVTLDARIQRLARESLANHLRGLADRNVRDGAVLVVDNASGEVLAYVGSAAQTSRAAAVDGVRAQRQAGSTLKPFLYGMAIERRYLTAASLLDDSALNLDTGSGVYIPQDYDHEFKGLVSVRTALAGSLNVPAVRTLLLVGVEPFRNRLQQSGYAGIREDGNFYGYSLALGSAEVSLWEQAQAYRALARGGRFSPLRLRASDPAGADRQVLPADASFVIADILSDPGARAVTFGLDNHLNTPFWSAVKTGTSKDMRDNWCIGFSRDYTVAVWVGNFEGDSMHEVSGVTGAAPVWHDVLLALQGGGSSRPPSPPAGLSANEVRFSPQVEPPRREWFLAGSELREVAAVPPRAQSARITSPANGMIIALDPDIPLRAQRVPVTTQGVDAGMSVTLNDSLLGRADRTLYWTPASGSHRFALKDRAGRILDRILVTVR
jgi:penicillin-binding protein 1C